MAFIGIPSSLFDFYILEIMADEVNLLTEKNKKLRDRVAGKTTQLEIVQANYDTVLEQKVSNERVRRLCCSSGSLYRLSHKLTHRASELFDSHCERSTPGGGRNPQNTR